MGKRDILTPVGLTIGFIMVMLAILSSGGKEGIKNFIDVASIFIVIGGTIGSLLINFKFEQIRLFLTVLKGAFQKTDHQLPELIRLFVHLADYARKEGLLALENELKDVDDPFIHKGVMLTVDGVDPDMIKDIMNTEITAMEERHHRGRIILEKAGEYAPAWGMIGTLIGLVLMLSSLNDPASLGPNMAVALLTTLYGTLLANLVFLPMASKLENKTEEDIFVKEIIVEGIIGIQSGQNPRILGEKLSAFLDVEPVEEPKEEPVPVEEKVHGT